MGRLGKNLVLAMVLVLVCLTLTACGKEKADVGMKTYTTAVLTLDDKALSKYGTNEKEAKEVFLKNFVDGFQGSSGGMFSKSEAEKFGEAFLDKLKTAEVKNVKVKDEKDGKATVEIEVDAFDASVLEKDLTASEQQELEKAKNEKEALDIVVKVLLDRVKDIKKKGTVTVTVNCKYDDKASHWMPEDDDKFVEDLYGKVMGM